MQDTALNQIFDLETFPIDQPGTPAYQALIARCKAELDAGGMFNLDGFLRPERAAEEANRFADKMDTESFLHERSHNIYFQKTVNGLDADHPALALQETSNNTLCADQLAGGYVDTLYNWPPLAAFLADVMDKPALYPMDDPLAGFNVMRYREGQTLNWHFDRSEFTVTLLLQAPDAGGVFEYRTDLRTSDDPNYDGVADLLEGRDPKMQQMSVVAGTLNVFRGVNTPHRVTKIQGDTPRVVSVLTYYENPGAKFTDTEQMGFYGRIQR
jgi:hypothetical protein